MLKLVLTFAIIFFINLAYTQEETRNAFISKTTEKVVVDGLLDENCWKSAKKNDDFFQHYPFDTSKSITKTEVYLTYDDNFLYIGAICFDDSEGNYTIQSLKRDFSYPVSDAFAVFIDTYSDKTTGFSFAVNPYGVQREGTLSNGGGSGVSTAWDTKWFTEVTRHKDKWIVEMAIPFKNLRYKDNIDKWRINFSRNNLKKNESSVWSPIPRNFNVATLAFTGKLNWDHAPNKPKANVVVIPYLSSNVSHEYTTNEKTDFGVAAGLDAKIAVSSSLNLDLTFNPDFSQVEVDRQVTNLSRFSLFFPERRSFFLENSDLFGQYGFRQIRPFFSRRIGLSSGSPIPILGGARLTGKLNNNWRLGIMNIQTEGVGDLNIDGQNYSVAALERKVLDRSRISAFFVNRQGFNTNRIDFSDYNRVAGIDFNYASKDNTLRGKTFYHQAFRPGQPKNSWTHATWLMYRIPQLSIMWNHEYVAENYLAEVGFVPRISNYNPLTDEIEYRSYWRLEPMVRYTFYNKTGVINNHGPELYLSEYLDNQYETTERKVAFSYDVRFNNQSSVKLRTQHNQTTLFYDTDITFTSNDNNIIPDSTYKYNDIVFEYASPRGKKYDFRANIAYGEYFVGNRLNYGSEISFRIQPWGIFSFAFQQNKIFLSSPNESTDITLIGPKVELAFTKKLFFSNFFQYNTQAKNFNINSRLQWRFKPMSDLFIVYTDNYIADILAIKNRALVIKLTYWFNL